jgi:hypothetical protein
LIPTFSDIIPFLSFLLEPSSSLLLPHSVLQTKSASGAFALLGYYAAYVGSSYDVSEQPFSTVFEGQTVLLNCQRGLLHNGKWNIHCVTSQKREDLIYAAAEA